MHTNHSKAWSSPLNVIPHTSGCVICGGRSSHLIQYIQRLAMTNNVQNLTATKQRQGYRGRKTAFSALVYQT